MTNIITLRDKTIFDTFNDELQSIHYNKYIATNGRF